MKNFSESLIDYIENELKQTTIATGLRQALNKMVNLGNDCIFVIKNSGYYTTQRK